MSIDQWRLVGRFDTWGSAHAAAQTVAQATERRAMVYKTDDPADPHPWRVCVTTTEWERRQAEMGWLL